MKTVKQILLIVVLFFMLTHVPAHAEVSSLSLLDFADILDTRQCLLASYTCKPFSCWLRRGARLIPGDTVCHNVPVAFVETTTGAFTTAVPFIGTVLSALSQAAGQQTGGARQAGDTHLQYFETRVFNVPTRWLLRFQMPFVRLCNYPEGNTFAIHYLSEADTVNWRTGLIDHLSIKTLIGGTIAQLAQICPIASIAGGNPPGDICMGTWGVTYPRTGFSNAHSEPVASGIAAYRASRVVAKPWGRVVFQSKNFSPNVQMQLGYPKFGKPKNCFDRGLTPAAWDNMTTKDPEEVGYIWVLWERRCCCIRPAGCSPLGL